MDVPVPQIHEDIVEVTPLIPRERISECTVEQVVDVPRSRDHGRYLWIGDTSACGEHLDEADRGRL